LVISLKISLDGHLVLISRLIGDVDALDSIFDCFNLLLKDGICVASFPRRSVKTLVYALILESIASERPVFFAKLIAVDVGWLLGYAFEGVMIAIAEIKLLRVTYKGHR
jgi:hypothetical protein